MTTNVKLSALRESGAKWAEIADFLGVSRQFLSEVRLGRKKLSPAREALVDQMVADRNRNHQSTPHAPAAYQAAASPPLAVHESENNFEERLRGIEARVAEIERAVIRLSNHVEKR